MSIQTIEKSTAPRPLLAQCSVCGNTSSSLLLEAPDRFHARKELYKLVRCGGCGLVSLTDPPVPHEMPFHYGEGYHKLIEDAGEKDLLERWGRHCDTVLGLKPEGGAILDIGCSSGAFLRTLKGKQWKLWGVDISEPEAARARAATGAEVFVGDPLDASFAPQSFDVITCFHLLEHVYQPLTLLKKIHTWLKPGGHFYVVLPNIDSWESKVFGSYWYGLELPRHLFHFSPNSLEYTVQRAQLRTVKLRTLVEDSFSEHSLHYIFEKLFGRVGIAKASLAAGERTSFQVKVVRRAFRMTIEFALRYASAAAGRGAAIEGVFCKER
jgi:SAM-dependent methyltransferase